MDESDGYGHAISSNTEAIERAVQWSLERKKPDTVRRIAKPWCQRRALEHDGTDVAIAESFAPMSDAERLAFFQEIIPLVKPQNLRWKADDWENPKEWIPRRRGL